ncbi:MAG: nucleotidyl transferase AbiEii/AbiGii toxin family protein [Acidobacteria bacterium]|nr:nucleotidyl transferase AbiEii/AbiGii toxin family protein [Acidobacteriota bacterium]
MTDQFSILKLVAGRLESAGIPYMLTGSIAAGYYAQPRMTRDIDVVIEVVPDDAERLATVFAADFAVSVDAIRAAISRRGLFNLIHVEAVTKVDFVVRKDAPYRIEEFRRRRRVEIGGHPFWIVSPEDLVLSKLAWAKTSRSELQLRDVRQLLAAVEPMGQGLSRLLGRRSHCRRSPAGGAGVTDAAADAQSRFDSLMRQRSGTDRVRMMSEMFDLGRNLVLSSLRASHPDATDVELRVLLFKRLYGDDIDPAEHPRIVASLQRGPRE